jgi:hypothetical protein
VLVLLVTKQQLQQQQRLEMAVMQRQPKARQHRVQEAHRSEL